MVIRGVISAVFLVGCSVHSRHGVEEPLAHSTTRAWRDRPRTDAEILAALLPADESAADPAPADPALERRSLGIELVIGPLVEALRDPPCLARQTCAIVRMPASFYVDTRVSPTDRVLNSLRTRVVHASLAIRTCMEASLRRDRCIRSGVAVLYRITRATSPVALAVDGVADGEALTCIDSKIRELRLSSLVPPGSGPVDLLISAAYQPAQYSALGLEIGGPVPLAADDPPCSGR